MLEASITDREQLTLARQLGLKSAMIVPIVARGRTLGAMTLVWAESGRRYSRDDLALAEELGRRAGIALDNAQLYEEAQRLNTELEHRVLTRTTQLETANVQLVREIAERRQAEEQVRILNVELEQRVAERTAQLEQVNRDLTIEIEERQKASQAQRALLRRMLELYHISQTIGTVRTPDEVLQALLSSSDLKKASRASIAIFEQPWHDDDRPELCDLLAAWNAEADLPLFVGQRFTLEGYGFIPPYSRDTPIVIEDIRASAALSERVRQRFEVLKTRSLIIFPLIAGDEWYGALSVALPGAARRRGGRPAPPARPGRSSRDCHQYHPVADGGSQSAPRSRRGRCVETEVSGDDLTRTAHAAHLHQRLCDNVVGRRCPVAARTVSAIFCRRSAKRPISWAI